MQKAGLAGWTIRGHLTPRSRVMAYAVDKGVAGANPVKQLDKGERPPVADLDRRVLERGQIAEFVAATPARYRPLVATVAFTGLRISEALGLVWADVDFEAGVVRVRKQLGHKHPRITLGIYAHEFDRSEQLERTRARLDAQHGTALESAVGDEAPAAAMAAGPQTASLPGFSD